MRADTTTIVSDSDTLAAGSRLPRAAGRKASGKDSGGPVGRRRGARGRTRRTALATASVIATLGALQLAGVTGLLDRDSFPLVSDVLHRLAHDVLSGATWTSVWHTLSQALAGLVVGGLLAVVIGLILGRAPLAERAVRPVVEFLRPIPSVAILPLVILTLGVGFKGALVLTGIASFWLVLVMTLRGAQAVDPVAQQTLISFRVPRWTWLWHLVLPSAMPFIVTGVRIAASVSLVVAVTVEMLGGMPGLGKDVQASLQNADTVGLYSDMVLTGLLGLAINAALKPLERRLLSWHPTYRGELS